MAILLEEVRQSPERTPHNLWRRETPGAAGWPRSARPGAPNKYFMFSADCHAIEPSTYLNDIEPQYRERIPHMEVRADGSEWLITEGNRPQAQRHAELAIRAVKLAAPFNLPPQVYSQYHRFKFSFDRKLSQ